MKYLRPGTFLHEVASGTLQVGSRPESMVFLSRLTPADIAWVRKLESASTRARKRKRPEGEVLSVRRKEILGYLEAADLLEEYASTLENLSVRIVGLDQIGTRVAQLLAAQGVKRLDLRDRSLIDKSVESAYPSGSSGLIREVALKTQIKDSHPEVRVGAIYSPDLVIVSGRRAWDHGTLGRLLSNDQVHLPITQDNLSVTIGPLVAPGVTACAVCVDLHRQAVDPRWAQSSFAMAAADQASPPEHLSVTAAGLTVCMVDSIASSRTLAGAVEPMGRVGGASQSWLVTKTGVRTSIWNPHPLCTCNHTLPLSRKVREEEVIEEVKEAIEEVEDVAPENSGVTGVRSLAA